MRKLNKSNLTSRNSVELYARNSCSVICKCGCGTGTTFERKQAINVEANDNDYTVTVAG